MLFLLNLSQPLPALDDMLPDEFPNYLGGGFRGVKLAEGVEIALVKEDLVTG